MTFTEASGATFLVIAFVLTVMLIMARLDSIGPQNEPCVAMDKYGTSRDEQ